MRASRHAGEAARGQESPQDAKYVCVWGAGWVCVHVEVLMFVPGVVALGNLRVLAVAVAQVRWAGLATVLLRITIVFILPSITYYMI